MRRPPHICPRNASQSPPCARSHWPLRGRSIRATTVSGALHVTRVMLRSPVRRSGLLQFRDMSGRTGRGRGRVGHDTPEARRLLPAIAGATANVLLQPSPAAPARAPFLEALSLVRTPTEAPRPDPRAGSAPAIAAAIPLPAANGVLPRQPPPRVLPPIQPSSSACPDAAEGAAVLADLQRRLKESELRATLAESSAKESAASAAEAHAYMQVRGS